jgi:DNA-binding Lrp family transcriptional regulator
MVGSGSAAARTRPSSVGSMGCVARAPDHVGAGGFAEAARSDAGGTPAVLSAYVLIQTEVGAAVRVARAVSELDGVERAEDVFGPYDVIARIQARSLDQLGRLVVARIQAVDGVTRTLTCPVVRL